MVLFSLTYKNMCGIYNVISSLCLVWGGENENERVCVSGRDSILTLKYFF